MAQPTWDEAFARSATEATEAVHAGKLVETFVAPPFSVLDTRQGYWQERRRAWLTLGIRSELGRQDDLLSLSPAEEARARWSSTEGRELQPGGNFRRDYGREGSRSVYLANREAGEDASPGAAGTSIFDPVLCELAYRWWAPEGGAILDPFAGGSVRGIVAATLGHPYTGIDLSLAQVEANRAQLGLLEPSAPAPTWVHGDSRQLPLLLPAGELYDMVWTCPPYFDLERYSDDPRDLSTMSWEQFTAVYAEVLKLAVARLRPNRFVGVVVSEIRGPTGRFRGLVPLTVQLVEAAGASYYNEAILVNSAGSAPLRVGKYMEAGRKLGRSHQNVLVFVKGEPERGWSHERVAPPSPQLALAMEPADTIAVTTPEGWTRYDVVTVEARLEAAVAGEVAWLEPQSPQAEPGPTIVHLEPEELLDVAGVARRVAKRYSEGKVATMKFAPPAGMSILDVNKAGFAAERAIAKLTGLPWGRGDRGRADVGTYIEVRWSAAGGLAVYDYDKGERVFVLVSGQAPDLTVHGWEYAFRVRERAELERHGGRYRGRSWDVPRHELRPLPLPSGPARLIGPEEPEVVVPPAEVAEMPTALVMADETPAAPPALAYRGLEGTIEAWACVRCGEPPDELPEPGLDPAMGWAPCSECGTTKLFRCRPWPEATPRPQGRERP